MSAVFDGTTSNQGLTASTLSGVNANERVFLVGWAKRTSTTEELFASLSSQSDFSQTHLGFEVFSSNRMRAKVYIANAVIPTDVDSFPQGSWRLCGMSTSFTGPRRHHVFFSPSFTYTGSSGSPSPAYSDVMAHLLLGREPGGATSMAIRLAEFAVFKNVDGVNDVIVNEDELFTELLTKTADNCTTASPLHYWPLLDDATATVGGVNLTNTGSVTFDSGDHPTLDSGAGPPASNFRRRAIWW